MKLILLVGMVLLILGVVALVYQEVTYTSREKLVQIGPLEASVDTEKSIPLPPLVGGLAVASGLVLVIVAATRL